MSNQITIEVPRQITQRDRYETDREVSLEQRKRVTGRYVTRMLSYQQRANSILRANRAKLKKTPQLTYHQMSPVNSAHVTNVRGRQRYR